MVALPEMTTAIRPRDSQPSSWHDHRLAFIGELRELRALPFCLPRYEISSLVFVFVNWFCWDLFFGFFQLLFASVRFISLSVVCLDG